MSLNSGKPRRHPTVLVRGEGGGRFVELLEYLQITRGLDASLTNEVGRVVHHVTTTVIGVQYRTTTGNDHQGASGIVCRSSPLARTLQMVKDQGLRVVSSTEIRSDYLGT